MEQEDREESVRLFKQGFIFFFFYFYFFCVLGKKDVLVATDVASKGLDFPDIQHVINYDMVLINIYYFLDIILLYSLKK
jgi:ATP-dependent RNA helicase DDX41